MRNDRERLLDIAEAIAKIEKYAFRGRDVFESELWIKGKVLNNAIAPVQSTLIIGG